MPAENVDQNRVSAAVFGGYLANPKGPPYRGSMESIASDIEARKPAT
ncbi:hypothetical protein SRABI98_00763 [Microbacterium sp. Bi98]|nr:hypothetical protein SRABI98_00763 [Microbacterium sp. Bi98]